MKKGPVRKSCQVFFFFDKIIFCLFCLITNFLMTENSNGQSR